jgi:transcription antitermination factor NusG
MNTENTAVENTETTTTVDSIEGALAKVKKAGRPKKDKDPVVEAVRAAKKAELKVLKDAARAEKKALREELKAVKSANRAAAKAEKAAERAAKRAYQVGDNVKIITGDLAGLSGTVVKCARLRVIVEVTGAKRPAYVFISDTEKA